MMSTSFKSFYNLFAKAISALIILVLVFLTAFVPCCAASGSKALPLSAGTDTLSLQFSNGVAGEENGYAIDYTYYSPVKKNDRTKYPLVIFLHGIGHGSQKGSQLKDSPLVYWSSRELQERWEDTNGAFLLLPRCPEEKVQYWNSSFVNPLRRMIDDFIEEHGKNIDTTRIFIGGSSAGGEMTWDMLTAYPEYFAGAFPMSATGTRSESDIKTCSNVAVWIFASKLDPIVNYLTFVKPTWNKICKFSSVPEKCRLSSFGIVCNPDGRIAGENHRLFQTINYDLFTESNESYPNLTTEDGKGNTVEMSYPYGVISWMSGIHSSFDGETSSDDFIVSPANIFTSFFKNIFLKIANIIQRILGLV